MPISLVYTYVYHLFDGDDDNPLHRPNLKKTGRKTACISQDISVEKLKLKSKSLGITINELILAMTSAALKEYFLSKGDEKT